MKDNTELIVGRGFRCNIAGKRARGKLQYEKGNWYLCQNSIQGGSCLDMLGYEFSWYVNNASNST
jgi:hypothetical protein